MVDLKKRGFLTRKSSVKLNHQLPWLSSPQTLTHDCTQCGKCLSACETNIIVKGDAGFPTVDFTIDECTFCYRCAEACPEDLFKDQAEMPWTAKIIIKDNCLAKQNVECRSCGDLCEPMAIGFKLTLGKVAQPELQLDQCNGCGACVSSCPSNAIDVNEQIQ
ncbi:ferredoxin-type protein NapF [Vibrio sp. FNV 38]|nr:ferredoxin-type protein NapF [Vibrio sp. FNV 38]